MGFGSFLFRSGRGERRPAVFLHIQKTAGTTVIKLAQKHYGRRRVACHGDFLTLDNRGRDTAHLPLDADLFRQCYEATPFLSGHFGYGLCAEFIKERYSFTFLRDPVERVLSYYYFNRTQAAGVYQVQDLAHRNGLEEFLQLGFTHPLVGAAISEHQLWQLALGYRNPAGRTPADFRPEEIEEMALRNLETFSHVGLLETFEQDRDIIFTALGMPLPARNVRSNVTPRRPRSSDLPDSILELLHRLTRREQRVYDLVASSRS